MCVCIYTFNYFSYKNINVHTDWPIQTRLWQLVIPTNWKQCLLLGEWLSKLWFTHITRDIA